MEIISIILGVLLLLGILFMPKSAYNDIKDDKIKLIFVGGRIIRLILIPVIAISLVGLGIYMIIDNRAEAKEATRIVKEEKERLESERKRRITIPKLLRVVQTPQYDKENHILNMDFEPGGQNEWGHYYIRDYETETIEKWDNGVIRYLTTEKGNYVRLKDSFDSLGYEFLNEDKNNLGDVIYQFRKDSIYISAGIFTKTKKYLIAIENPYLRIKVKPFIEEEEFIGKWGRVGERSGTIEVKSDGTFRFRDSKSGSISGNWSIDKKKITFNYGNAKDADLFYYAAHPFNQKTEIFYIESKTHKEISGTVSGARFNSQITLRSR